MVENLILSHHCLHHCCSRAKDISLDATLVGKQIALDCQPALSVLDQERSIFDRSFASVIALLLETEYLEHSRWRIGLCDSSSAVSRILELSQTSSMAAIGAASPFLAWGSKMTLQ